MIVIQKESDGEREKKNPYHKNKEYEEDVA